MGKTARIIWSGIGIAVMAAMMIAAVWYGYYSRPTDKPCAAIEFIIEDSDKRLYLSEQELTGLLRTEEIYPVGKQVSAVSLHRIERAVLRHPMVRTAECYLTPRQVVKVRLTQRVPLLMVAVPGEAYFIDTDRRVMPIRASVRDRVPVVTGAVGVQTAATSLADFAEWLRHDAYWSERIHQLHVQSPQMIILKVEQGKGNTEHGKWNVERVVLGPIRGYARKLNKLRTFLENSPREVREKPYRELDIRFHGQVIGRY